MKGFIYKITNKVNGKSYIGQTRYTVEFRWRLHLHKKDKVYFHNAIHKYGSENFTVDTLEECDVRNLNEREIFYIAKYNTFKNGYNMTIGGDGNRNLLLDDKYDEIQSLYLAGFSSNKIATLYLVDKASIVKILKQLGVKIRNNSLNINKQEFEELVLDYKNGYSLRELAKRYNCSSPGLKELLIKKGINIKEKYSILNDKEKLKELIKDYTSSTMKLADIQNKYHCSYATLLKVLSINGVSKGKYSFKLSAEECLNVIADFNKGKSIRLLSKHYKVDVGTIYSLFKRYNVNYLTV